MGEVSLLVRHNLLRQVNNAEHIEAVLAPRRWRNARPGCPSICRTPSAAGVQQRRGARLAATNPAWARFQRARGQQFGLHMVSHAIQDEAYNRTRFAVICLPHTLATAAPSGHDCTSLIISVPNRPGAVHDLLVPLKKRHGVDDAL